MNIGNTQSSTRSCCACLTEGSVEIMLNFGHQPPSNRFEVAGHAESDRHPLIVGQCQACALVQLVDPMPTEMVASRFDWLTYNEPESHLDRTVDKLGKLLGGAHASANIQGLTYKDESTLRRFKARGSQRCVEVDLPRLVDADIPRTAIERIQDLVSVDNCQRAAKEFGRADLLIVRHVLEHAHRPREFIDALREMVAPGGLVVFEVPDSSRFLDSGDVCFFWEEHVTYFTESTLGRFIASAGRSLEALWVEPYPMENSLIAVVRLDDSAVRAVADAQLAADLAKVRELTRQHMQLAERCRTILQKYRDEGRRVYGFGAGHLAAKFVNLNDVGDLLEGVIDDSPDKQGLRMPGSGLPIVGSDVLESGGADLCLLSLSPESEARVVAARSDYLEAGGEMRSMFSLSPRALVPSRT